MDASANSPAPLELDRQFRAPELLAWCGTLTIAGLLRFSVQIDWIAPSWAALVCALGAIAWMTGQRIFLHQGVFLAFVVVFRGVMHNFYERSYFLAPPLYSRSLTVGVTVALLFLALFFAFRVRGASAQAAEGGVVRRMLSALGRNPEQVFFFGALVLLTALLAAEFHGGNITIAWGVEAVAIFLFALWVGERSFRLSGLGLLLLCVGKIVLADFWRLGMRDRAVTFLVLGGSLVLVSIFYSRKRELFRRFL